MFISTDDSNTSGRAFCLFACLLYLYSLPSKIFSGHHPLLHLSSLLWKSLWSNEATMRWMKKPGGHALVYGVVLREDSHRAQCFLLSLDHVITISLAKSFIKRHIDSLLAVVGSLHTESCSLSKPFIRSLASSAPFINCLFTE